MDGNKLVNLNNEISHYIGIPYFTNVGKHKNDGDNVLVGKGTAKQIALKTVELANLENINLTNLSPQQIYNFQKKHHLGIDCSGIACHLLNYYWGTDLNPRKTSADMLTSPPLAKKINIKLASTGDLIRQKDGHHVLFIIEKLDNIIHYVDSSVQKKGVSYGQFDVTDKSFLHQGIFRLV